MSSKIFGPVPVCVGSFSGVGNVGKLATDRICASLGCQTQRSIVSPGFPPQVTVTIDGQVRMHQVELRSCPGREDLLFFSCDTQPPTPESMYGLAGEILEAARSWGSMDVITLAAYVGPSEDEIFGATTDPRIADELERRGISLLKNGIVGGLNGILVGLAPLYGMRGVCLMGKTAGEEEFDPVAANHLIEAVGRLLDLDVPLEKQDLDKGPVDESYAAYR